MLWSAVSVLQNYNNTHGAYIKNRAKYVKSVA